MRIASTNVPKRMVATALLATAMILLSEQMAVAQLDFEGEPINYGSAEVHDRISKLQQDVETGKAKLVWDKKHGWLPSLLEHLEVPAYSQLLVFSKTSLQLRRITPERPRAVYFSDDTYVGWVQNGDVVELSAVDPQQGAIFYTVSQKKTDRPEFRRDRGQCLACHASSKTKGVPGYLVRSVFPGDDGQPHYGLGTTTTDHTTRFEDRYGGWYVTGTHGKMRHHGNAIARDDPIRPIDPEPGANRSNLAGLVQTSPYLEPGSDLVALMVLDHQSQMHNLITRASYETRQAIHYDQTMNRVMGRPAEHRSDTTRRRIASAGEKLVRYLLFSDEWELKSPVQGTSEFAARFSALGPKDRQGRSLRDFDLGRRMFRYPCSYLIYSESFDALPDAMLDYVETRLALVLTGKETSAEFAHLSAEDRKAILEILVETKPRFRERLAAITIK